MGTHLCQWELHQAAGSGELYFGGLSFQESQGIQILIPETLRTTPGDRAKKPAWGDG
jgi:hypothetical protein